MLRQKLDALFRMTAGADGQPPIPAEIVIAEVGPSAFDEQGHSRIILADLRTPNEYEGRFAALMAKGYPWLNLSFYGFIDGKGLVVVELPYPEPQAPSRSTSVNLSGPPAIAAASGWDARSHVMFL